nr:DUF2703 domain-containing protein [Pyrinomonadaceae bacterium]
MTENNTCGTGGCGCSQESGVASDEKIVAVKNAEKEINIEFLYLDLNVCEMCKGTESNLEEALAEVSEVLKSTGVKVNLQKTHIETYEQALALDFISSPTIRINGRDAALEVKENYCSSCSDLSGTETFCRVWNFGGEEFSTVPKSLVIETILKEIYGGKTETAEISAERKAQSLENLKRFFAGINIQADSTKANRAAEQINPPVQIPQ